MPAEILFSAVSTLALVSWLTLAVCIFFRMDALRDHVLGRMVPMFLALMYLGLIVFFFAQSSGGFDSLSNVKLLFTSDWMVLAGWVHYLAFDLFVGCWIARETARASLPRWPLLFILPLTFLFGPIGYLAFEISRFVLSSKTEVTL